MKNQSVIIGGILGVVTLTICVCAGLAMLLPTIARQRQVARKASCTNQMKQLGLGFHNYHSAYKQLPTASGGTGFGPTPMDGNEYRLSGFVAMLPFLEQQALWEQVSNPYSDSAGIFNPMGPVPWTVGYAPFETSVPLYLCPDTPPVAGSPGYGTSYAFCYGDCVQYAGMNEYDYIETQDQDPRTLPVGSPLAEQVRKALEPTQRGMFVANRRTKFREILDGLSNTIAMGEVANFTTENWARSRVAMDAECLEPDRAECVFLLETDSLASGTAGRFASNVPVWNDSRGERWADGRIRITGLTTVAPPNGFSATPVGSEFGGIYSAGSHHAGGVHVLMADGAVKFIEDSIDCGNFSAPGVRAEDGESRSVQSSFGLWGSMGSREGMEVINL